MVQVMRVTILVAIAVAFVGLVVATYSLLTFHDRPNAADMEWMAQNCPSPVVSVGDVILDPIDGSGAEVMEAGNGAGWAGFNRHDLCAFSALLRKPDGSTFTLYGDQLSGWTKR